MKNTRGFTIIEVIIAISVSLVIFLAIVGVYQISQNAYRRNDARAEITQNGRVILDRLVRELRQTPDVVTNLPPDTSDPDALAHEIMFQDGHDISTIKYIRYFLDATDVKRQIIVYYFSAQPSTYVHWFDKIEDEHEPPNVTYPTMEVLEEKLIGEYAADMEFWGENLINVNLYLNRDGQSSIINTAIYGRNL